MPTLTISRVPGDAVQKMVESFHQQGIHVQIWWLPLAVEDGQGRYESHRYALAKVAKEHPDWLILDKNGRHAHLARGLAALCPALPVAVSPASPRPGDMSDGARRRTI